MAERKAQTSKITGGADYAKVSERLKLFREDSPRGLIETSYEFQGDMVVFTARILKDKSDEFSAEATGHAFGETKNKKEFEKLESIAVGRALALLGYLASGEIASSEEMEEFLDYQEIKREAMIFESTEKLNKASSLKELGEIWVNLPVEAKKSLETLKNDMKTRLGEKNDNK